MGEDPGQIRQDIEQTRAEMGDTVGALAHKADVKGRAKDSITQRAAQVKQGAGQAAGIAQENPIGIAIGGVAVGFLAGMMIPSTRIEDERMGRVADQAKDKAREAGQEAVERGKAVVQETAQTAAETAREKSSEQAQELGESTQQKAHEAVQA